MKKIGIDIYKIKDIYSGLGQFCLHFKNEISKYENKDFEFHYFAPEQYCKEHPDERHLIPEHFKYRYFSNWCPVFDLWHSLHQFPSHLPNPKSPLILTIHDLNFLIEKSPTKAKAYLKKLQNNVDRATIITTISDYTKTMVEDHIQLKGKKVSTIHNGVYHFIPTDSVKPEYVSGDFFFGLSVFKEKKNFHTLIPMMKYFDKFQLILAGNHDTEYGRSIMDLIRKEHLESRVILPGKISDQQKRWLYNNCTAFMFPSLAEGFGNPPIEAMQHGKPVFLSNACSLPEIGGSHAYYFEHFDTFYMVEKVKLSLEHYYNHLEMNIEAIKKHASQFSWDNAISKYLQIYRDTLNV